MQPDQKIIPYTVANDPLPSDLNPAAVEYHDHLTNSIALLDEEITLLEDTLRQRKEKRKELCDRREPFHILLHSPIRMAPPEVIASIISECLAAERSPLNDVGRRRFAGYRAVCKLWRETLLSTPAFWRTLQVRICDFHRVPNLVAQLESWFSRAGRGKPVELKLKRQRPTCYNTYCMSSEQLGLLSGLIFGPNRTLQFQSIAWDGPFLPDEGIRTLLEPKTTCSSLKILAMYYHDSSVKTFPRVGTIFPMLQDLYISAPLSETMGAQLFPMAHPNLRALCLVGEGGSLSDVRSLLGLLPGLEEVSLQFIGSRPSSTGGPLIHDKIRSFLVGIERGDPVGDIFSAFVFPSLELLILYGEPPRFLALSSEGYPGLDHFLQACRPKRLTLALESRRDGPFASDPALSTFVAIMLDARIPSKQIVWDSSHLDTESMAVACRSVCEGSQELDRADSDRPLAMYCHWPEEGEAYQRERQRLRTVGVELMNLSLPEIDVLTHQPIRYRRLRHKDLVHWLWTLRE